MAQSHILQVVNGDGEFDETRVSEFLASHSINDVGVGYQVVAITGPQSSGKSTLMNAVVSLLAKSRGHIQCVVMVQASRAISSFVEKVYHASQVLNSSPNTFSTCLSHIIMLLSHVSCAPA